MKKSIVQIKHLIITVFTLFSFTVFAQESKVSNEMYTEIDIYKTTLIPKKFAIEFKDSEDKFNFKKLREFLNEKESLKKRLTYTLDENRVDPNNQILLQKIKDLKDLIADKKNPNDTVNIKDYNYTYNESNTSPSTVKKITTIINKSESLNADNEKKNKIYNVVNDNIANIKQDIKDCEYQIDIALAPENRQQEFKTTMSMCFVGLILIILVSFFSIIYLRSDFTLSKDLLGGYGLQFITLFVLIIAIILFGILEILKGSELAAMLSGISGYILGKGIQDKKLLIEPSNINTAPIIQDSKKPTENNTPPAS